MAVFLIVGLPFEAIPWTRMARHIARMWNPIVFPPTAARSVCNAAGSGVRAVDLERIRNHASSCNPTTGELA